MDQSILMKLVWLGAITAIPVAVWAVQKPEAHRSVETRRVVSVEQPVAVEVAGEVQGPRPAEPAPAPEVPRTVVMGGARIKVKSGPSAEQAPPAAAAMPGSPSPAGAGAAAVTNPLAQDRQLTVAVAPVPGVHR